MTLSAVKLALLPGYAEAWKSDARSRNEHGTVDVALHVQCMRNMLYIGVAFIGLSALELSYQEADLLQHGAFALLGAAGFGVSYIAAEELHSQVRKVSAVYSSWRAAQKR